MESGDDVDNGSSSSSSSSHRGLLLVLDWDGTATRRDTTSSIGRAAIGTRPENAGREAEIMAACTQAYLQEASEARRQASGAVVDGMQAAPAAAAAAALDLDGRIDVELHALDATEEAERRSFRRVRAAAGAGAAMTDPKTAAAAPDWAQRMRAAGRAAVERGDVELRDPAGLVELVSWASSPSSSSAAAAARPRRDWAVVSVSFSREFILGAMQQSGLIGGGGSGGSSDGGGGDGNGDHDDAVEQARKRIFCNELLANQTDDGLELQLIQTARDKLRAMGKAAAAATAAATAAAAAAAAAEATGGKATYEKLASLEVIYVGDSVTDAGCLLGADLGICVRDAAGDGSGGGDDDHPGQKNDDELAKLLRRLSLDCPHVLGEAVGSDDIAESSRAETTGAQSRHPARYPANVCWTDNFRDVLSRLRGTLAAD